MVQRTCTVKGCDKPIKVKSRGWCWMHYKRWQKHGSVDVVHVRPRFRYTKTQKDPRERFWSKVDLTLTCWRWMGGTNGIEYGMFYIGGGRKVLAHRYAYEQLVGPIPDGLVIDHLCRNPRCVNPDHLEPVTQRVNNLRGESPFAKKARQTHCKHGHELTEENVYRKPGRPNSRECRTCMAEREARRPPRRQAYGAA